MQKSKEKVCIKSVYFKCASARKENGLKSFRHHKVLTGKRKLIVFLMGTVMYKYALVQIRDKCKQFCKVVFKTYFDYFC